MLEYTIDDAEALLTKNLAAAIKSLDQVDEDLGFLRDQITTVEVSILLPKRLSRDLCSMRTMITVLLKLVSTSIVYCRLYACAVMCFHLQIGALLRFP